MTRFRLVNPYVKGSIGTSTKSNQPIYAAKKLYSRIADLFANNLPSYFFTIENQSTGELHHFESNERKSGVDVSYTIRSVNMSRKGEKTLRKMVSEKDTQTGAGKEDKSTTSSAVTPVLLMPIDTWVYMASGYQILDSYLVTQVYLPVFLESIVVYPVLMMY